MRKMKIQSILLITFLTLTTSIAYSNENEKAMLNRFLYAKNAADRLHAFDVIISNKDNYKKHVLNKLQLFSTKPDKTPDALLYLAAYIKDQRYIRPLSTLINNDTYSTDHCIYSCPIVFSLVVFSSFTGYSLPELNDTLTAVYDFKSEREKVKNISIQPEHANNYARGPGIDPLLREMETLPISDVIKIAGPKTSDGLRRMAAAVILQAHIADDKHLNELYWLAISDLPNDASGEYRDAIHWAIYKAETYRSRRKKKS